MPHPYHIELTVHAVIMAESEHDAFVEAECSSHKICAGSELTASPATRITSLEHLAQLAPADEWDGDSIPYCGDGETRLRDLLPETDTPARDTRTADLFGTGTPAP